MPTIREQRFLLDTNVILRYADNNHALYPIAAQAVKALVEADNVLYIAPQNCVEFWNVATRPKERNGFGLTTQQVAAALGVIEQIFQLLADSSAIYGEWRRLVTTVGVSGVQVHDARLVAIMHVNQISHILTFNTKDFIRYNTSGITAIDPSQI